MANIQIRIDDNIKSEADSLFSSLGLDTSTAVRMFISAALNYRGIPFIIAQNTDRDEAIKLAIERRKAGEPFVSAEESLTRLMSAIKRGAERAL